MAVNGVNTSPIGAYNTANVSNARTKSEDSSLLDQLTPTTDNEAAVYEPSKRVYTMDADTVDQMKAELEQRMSNLVQMMMGQQIKSNDIWEALRTGNFTVDEETQQQAQRDIAEDGYWGVEQTSDRIIKYATALTGGDPDKLDSMIAAFEQGYAEAEKQWGGTLPELAQQTREAVLQKFQDLKDQNANAATAAVQ